MSLKIGTTDHLDYFPLRDGLPRMAIGLKRLGTDAPAEITGSRQSERDKVFQIDASYSIYREAKIAARFERLAKYYQFRESPPPTLTQWMVERVCSEHPQHFNLEEINSGYALHLSLTGERLVLSRDFQLELGQSRTPFTYVDAFDALATNLQEDLVFMRQNPEGGTEARLIHLCVPNDWAAERAIGQSFESIHKPVPGIDTIIRRPQAMIQGIIQQKANFERVGAIGFRTQTRLNEHPEVSGQIRSPAFNSKEPSLFVRFERQTVTGFPDLGGFLFTIRTYFRDLVDVEGKPNPKGVLQKVFQEDFTGQHVNHYSKTFIEAHRAELLRWIEL